MIDRINELRGDLMRVTLRSRFKDTIIITKKVIVIVIMK